MTIPAGLPFSGVRGRISINNVNQNLNMWSIDPTADLDDVTTFEDVNTGGVVNGVTLANDGFTYQVDIAGVNRINGGKIGGYWDGGNTPSSQGIVRGAIVGPVYLYIDKVGNRAWKAPYIRIASTPIEVTMAGSKATQWSANFKSYGPWVEPT